MYVGRSDRHGNHGSHRSTIERLPGRVEKGPEPARRDGQHDVIDRATQRLADGADIGQRHGSRAVVAVGAQPAGEHGRRRAGRAEQQAEPASDLGQAPSRGHGMANGVGVDPQPVTGSIPDAHQRPEDLLVGGRFGIRVPVVGARRGGLGLQVEESGHDVCPADPVGQGVVPLQDGCPVPIRQALHQPRLPQRPTAVELLFHDPTDHRRQLSLVAGRWKGGAAHVVVDREVGVVDPEWPGQAAGSQPQLLTKARRTLAAAPRCHPESRSTREVDPRKPGSSRCSCG